MKKIIIIEDEINILESIIDILKLKNVNVIATQDANEGVFWAYNQNPGFIICDIIMPKINGFRALFTPE